MAPSGEQSGEEKQGSLFGHTLPTTAPKQKRKSRRKTPPAAGGSHQLTPAAPTASPPPSIRPWRIVGGWAGKVFVEAIHKEAVKGARIFIWVVVGGLIFGFFAFMKIDVGEKLRPLWSYVDAIETQIFAKGHAPKGNSQIETGDAPPRKAQPNPPAKRKGDGWTVDVFPERD